MWEWLTSQAQSASPFVAVFCLLGLATLWRENLKKEKTILSLTQSFGAAMTSIAVALEKGTAATQAQTEETRALRTDVNNLRVAVGGGRRR